MTLRAETGSSEATGSSARMALALHDGAGDGAALLLAARQGVGALAGVVGDADAVQGGHGHVLVGPGQAPRRPRQPGCGPARRA
jgi:hypothetical protein